MQTAEVPHIGQLSIIGGPEVPQTEKSRAADERNPLIHSLSMGSANIRRFSDQIEAAGEMIVTDTKNVLRPVISVLEFQIGNHTISRLQVSFIFNGQLNPDVSEQLKSFLIDNNKRNYVDDFSLTQFSGFALPRHKTLISGMNLFARGRNAQRMLTRPQRQVFWGNESATRYHKDSELCALLFTEQETYRPLVGTLRNIGRNFLDKPINNPKITFIVDPTGYTEAQLATTILQFQLILQNPHEYRYTGDEKDFEIRRTLFLHAYRTLISDQFSPAGEGDVVGLDEQQEETETHLLKPLITGHGIPQSIAFIGPPGTGKTLTIRRLISKYSDQIVFAPIRPYDFHTVTPGGRNIFNMALLEGQRLWNDLHIPTVYLVDDAEHLFSPEVAIDESTKSKVSAADRSRILEILNGMGARNAHFIFSFNKPEVLDLANRRRLFPIIFQLPDDQQRLAILSKIVPSGVFTSEDERNAVIAEIVKRTNGWNNAYLAQMTQFAHNLRSHNPEAFKSSTELYLHATSLTRAIADIRGLQHAEKIAQDIRSQRDGMGFNPE